MTEAERIRRARLDELAWVHQDLATAQQRLDRAVEDARQARLTWTAIGNAIGITKQGARQRWGP